MHFVLIVQTLSSRVVSYSAYLKEGGPLLDDEEERLKDWQSQQ